MSPEDAEELELLRRDVEVLGGDPNAVLVRAQGPAADFRDVSTSRYEYLDPSAPGAAPGEHTGPMADELRHLGVVKPGPQGHDMVDTAGLGFKNASATGELAREVESLRKEVDTLRGNPDAVLSRVNKPTAPASARQGTTIVEEPQAEPFGGPAARSFGPRAEEQFIKGVEGSEYSDLNKPIRGTDEIRARRAEELETWLGRGDRRDAPLPEGEMWLQRSGVAAENVRDANRASERRVRDASQDVWRKANAGEAARMPRGTWQQQRAQQNSQVPMDRDERDRQDTLYQARLLYNAERDRARTDAAIGEYLRDMDAASPTGRTHASPEQLMEGVNTDAETGEVVGDYSTEQIRRALRRREELYL